MDTILQNRIVITDNENNPREYFFEKPLPYPEAGSDRPVESDYLYQLERKLVHFLGRGVTNRVFAGNVNVPTSSAVYDAIKNLSGLDPVNVPSGYTLTFRGADNKLYYLDGDTLVEIPITSGQNPQYSVNVEYNENNHSLVYGNVQINASAAIDNSEIVE